MNLIQVQCKALVWAAIKSKTQTVNSTKRQRAPPLAPAHVTTPTHNMTGGGVLKANVCMIHKSLVFDDDWGGRGFHFPSILIKYFDPWTTCSGLNGLSPWPDRFIRSQCNYWQTNNQRTVSRDSLPAWVQLLQWNPNWTFTTSRSPLAP